jgi:Uma2 family endonuclease
MEVLQLEPRPYTRGEYFALLEASLHKLAYLNGQIRMMSGGSIAHNDIINNTFTALRVNQGSCKIKGSENTVAINNLNTYFFPDLTVTCKKPAYEEGGDIARINNPELIIEVLSKSTSDYDRTDKFTAYRQLDSFKE